MRPTILNRDFTLPSDSWYQIEASGEHPNFPAGIVQVIDDEAVESIVKNFNPGGSGMLIDIDHFSHDLEKSTRAHGWLMAVENRDGKLYGKIKWTHTGKPAVEGGDFRFFSSEYEPEDLQVIDGNRVRPRRMSGLTLTNRPNNKGGAPISNREKARPLDVKKQSPNKQDNTMQKIAKMMGLAETATPEEVEAAVSKMLAENMKMSEENGVMNKQVDEIRNREVAQLMEKYAPKIGDDESAKTFFKDGLTKNREATEKALAAMPALKVAVAKEKIVNTPIHNRQRAARRCVVAGEEAGGSTAEAGDQDREAEQARVIGAIRNRDKSGAVDAFNQARLERPELFIES